MSASREPARGEKPALAQPHIERVMERPRDAEKRIVQIENLPRILAFVMLPLGWDLVDVDFHDELRVGC